MSLVLGIRFLTGYCVAARSKTDEQPEWPPHPARVFMALAAAHFECFDESQATAAALRWLERLGDPHLLVPCLATIDADVVTYVPMNSSSSVAKGGPLQSLPSLSRRRDERRFPRKHLPEPFDCVYLAWPDAEPGEHRDALAKLCSAVGRIGHSSSLVSMWLAETLPEASDDWELLQADDLRPKRRLRVPAAGTLDRLVQAFQAPPHRATVTTSRGYSTVSPADAELPTTLFDPSLELFRLESAGPRFRWLQLETTLALAQTLREAILANCREPIPESISGHRPDGSPSQRPHLAILPLPHVDNPYADGHLLGVAIAVPRDMPSPDQQILGEALDRIASEGELRTGTGLGFDARRFPGLGQWTLTRPTVFDQSRVALSPDTWTKPQGGARAWATVTPFVFDHHSKAKSKAAYLEEAAELVREAIGRVAPAAEFEAVQVTDISPLQGVPPARDFPRLRRKDGSERRHLHVVVQFAQPLVGPLIAGAGRYRGYGFFRPLHERGSPS